MLFNFYSESRNHSLLTVINSPHLYYKINLLLLVPILKNGPPYNWVIPVLEIIEWLNYQMDSSLGFSVCYFVIRYMGTVDP